ncbi:hypothetical protein SISSUDRAFT_458940 [Sistotremastrum suecicum HHB10207 ss-3]|uniref:Uncharacterized protein n=1 Tax=Sistotremastrum suecicum HHB10207 ss-3 TaxID=1314776 RepID=A0A165Y723_9AGAM|nr:hypothetical protein SISSUDRAFT_458940 [Sistotremastrum suecicum HHB10207 ss-3]
MLEALWKRAVDVFWIDPLSPESERKHWMILVNFMKRPIGNRMRCFSPSSSSTRYSRLCTIRSVLNPARLSNAIRYLLKPLSSDCVDLRQRHTSVIEAPAYIYSSTGVLKPIGAKDCLYERILRFEARGCFGI